jgi:hypothetical protein
MAGYSTDGVAFVQSPVADTIMSGRGAANAPISMFDASNRINGEFSHMHPPCIVCEIMLTGAETFTRGSTAIYSKVCVPPPYARVLSLLSGCT